MNRKIVATLAAGILLAAGLLAGRGIRGVNAQNEPARIEIDYPLNGSVFPPDMAAPDVSLARPGRQCRLLADRCGVCRRRSAAMHVDLEGRADACIGEIDQRCISNTNKLPELTPEQAAAHTWKPDAATWAAIERQAGKPAPSRLRNSAALRRGSGEPASFAAESCRCNFRRPGERAHLLSRCAADAVGDGEGIHQAAGHGCDSAHQLAHAQCGR
jgi:hypothetical protein